MAKYCSNCGHELREGDKFCAECATPVNSQVAPGRVLGYETCEIKWRRKLSWPIYQFVFYAEAIGPQGMYDAGQSAAVSNMKSPIAFGASTRMGKMQGRVQDLVALLTSQGWEPVSEKGLAWWNYRFRRQVRG